MRDSWGIKQHRVWTRKLRGLLLRSGKAGAAAEFFTGPTLRFAENWGWEENLQGFCFSWKRGAPTLTFLVQKKIHESRLSKKEFIPEALRHRQLKLEIETCVWEVGDRLGLSAQYGGALKRGLAVGHGKGYPSGTLGFVVERKVGALQSRSILSCAHVLAWTMKGRSLPQAGDLIEQPVSLDSDPEDFLVAKLAAGFTDLTKKSVKNDFALADVLPGLKSAPQGGTTVSARKLARDFPNGLAVRTHGRVSGKAEGKVTGVEGTVKMKTRGNVDFPFWLYQDLIVYSVKNQAGDSGAAVYEADGSAAGLHVGGNGDNLGLFYPVRPIFDEFQLKLPG